MRLAAGLAAGIALGILATRWRHPVAWVLTRIPPATHPSSAPRARAWRQGVEVSCPLPPT